MTSNLINVTSIEQYNKTVKEASSVGYALRLQ